MDRIDSPDSPDSADDSGVLEPGDSLYETGPDGGVDDVLDEGWSPAERPWASTDWGTTGEEESAGEPLAGRLARELPDGPGDDGDDGLGDSTDTDGELRDAQVGDRRAGRLLAGEDGSAQDGGIDGAGASAEEAAVHVVPD